MANDISVTAGGNQISVVDGGNGISIAAKGTQGSKGTPGTVDLIDQAQLVYVSKVGVDGNSGLNIDSAKSTLTAAITTAIAMTPSQANQITIQIVDTGDYIEEITLPEWVHLFGPNASTGGRITISDNCIVELRRSSNTLTTSQCIRKLSAGGLSRVTLDLMIVASGQEGVRCDSGSINLTFAAMVIDNGEGLVAKDASKVTFNIQTVIMTDNTDFIITTSAGGGANAFYGEILRVEDDDTCRFIKLNVPLDTVDIQGGSVVVQKLYNLSDNAILNLYVNTATGTRVLGTGSQANVMDLAGVSNLQGDLNIEGNLTGPSMTAKEDAFSKNTAFNKNFGTGSSDVCEGADSRLSDARTPTAHAASHTDGSDDIQNATASQKGLATSTQITKLDGIATGAEVNTINSGDNVSLLSNDAGYISSVVWGDITGLLTNQTDLQAALDAKLAIVTSRQAFGGSGTPGDPLDLTAFKVILQPSDLEKYGTKTAGVYKIPADRYYFKGFQDYGTDQIEIEDQDGIYVFAGAHFDLIQYTGTGDFIFTSDTGTSLNVINLFMSAPNGTVIDMNGSFNSCILDFPVFVNCKECCDLDTGGFSTNTTLVMVVCENGVVINDVGTTTMRLAQWSVGQNIASSVAITMDGAASERLFINMVDSRPLANECFLDIKAGFGGDVSIVGGVHDTSTGGDFFLAGARDQKDVDIIVNSVKHVPNSQYIGSALSIDNSGTISISEDVWTDLNQTGGGAVVSGSTIERFELDNATTGQLEYIGVEAFSGIYSATVTFIPTGSKNYEFRVIKNGSPLSPAQVVPGSSQGGANLTVPVMIPVEAVTGDLFRMQVQCIDGDDDIDVAHLSISIK